MSKVIFLFIFIFSVGNLGAQTINPFTASEKATSAPQTPEGQTFPNLLAQFNHQLSDLISQLSDAQGNFQIAFLIPLLFIAFLYGIFHGLGPGHGKTAAAGFFLGKDSKWRHPFLLGGMIAIVHALVSITLVLVLFFLIKGVFLLTFGKASAWTGAFGYGLVSIMGLFMTASAVLSLKTKGKKHLHFFKICSDERPHHDGGQTCDNHEHCHHDHPHSQGQTSFKELLFLAFAIAVVPCPGAVTLMLFSVVQKVPVAGIWAVLALSLGMALTVSGAGLVSVLVRKGIFTAANRGQTSKDLDHGGQTSKRPLPIALLQLAGSLILTLFGLGLFFQNLYNF